MVTLAGRKVIEKLNEQKGKVLGAKMDEIDEFTKPYTIVRDDGWEELSLPDQETTEKYLKLHKEFQEIVNEINLIDKN